ncbi:hypothetical protein LCGC14_1446990 [marine sediment metagenome]|uniref:Uncharacterized protein n=1 Tax=marine sediment metagenome TaxID=412755 RepID=A0A0F9JJQ6_9ZZZZ
MDQWFLDQARQGNVYHSHNTTAGAVTVISATCTGLVLENPINSRKNLVVARMSFTGSTLDAIGEMGIAISREVEALLSSTTTAAVIHNGRLSGSNANNGVGRSYSIATLASPPVWLRPLASLRQSGGTEADNATPSLSVDFDGTAIVTPGTYICFSTLTRARTGLCSMTWAEIDE